MIKVLEFVCFFAANEMIRKKASQTQNYLTSNEKINCILFKKIAEIIWPLKLEDNLLWLFGSKKFAIFEYGWKLGWKL